MKTATYLLITLLLLFNGCDRKQPPKEVDLDTIYDEIPAYSEHNTDPYQSRFKYVMDLSYPKNSDSSFYLDTNENLHFVLTKPENSSELSSELIQKETWSTSDKEGNYFVSLARCYKPKEIDSYIWVQAHGPQASSETNSSIYYNYPLLSLSWEREFKNVYDHIWATITKSSPSEDEPKIYEYIDLGERPDNFFSTAIHIRDNILEIKINYKTKSTQNVSYWSNVPTNFIAGIYINKYLDGGEAGVAFSDLRFENNDTNVDNITHF